MKIRRDLVLVIMVPLLFVFGIRFIMALSFSGGTLEEKLTIYDTSSDTRAELVAYRLDNIGPSSSAETENDIDSIRTFLVDQEKRQLFNKWMDTLKKNADIQILTDKI